MRVAFSIAALAAALVPTGAEAQCPASATEAVAALDPAIARNRDDQSAWPVTGLSLLNRPVPYVVVQRHEGQIANIYYRLGRDTARVRRGGEEHDGVPDDVEARFHSIYLDRADCNEMVCSASPDEGYGVGVLENVYLAPQWLEVGPAWTGPAVARVTAEQDPADAVTRMAIYLTCGYNATVRGW